MNARYTPGDRVRVRAHAVAGHCRTPHYLRGRQGVIARVLGAFANPEERAYHRSGLPPEPLYQVEFNFAEVWGRSEPRTVIAADLYEHWLEPPA